jgi:hypothetical protein
MYQGFPIVTNQFTWSYAPSGYAGTVVVIYVNPATKKLYSAFVNVTFSATPVAANLTETNEANLNAQLDLLN